MLAFNDKLIFFDEKNFLALISFEISKMSPKVSVYNIISVVIIDE
jgi:hypothetical protein